MPRILPFGSGSSVVSAEPGDSIAPGQSVFGPFGSAGRLVNDTQSAIVLNATDPPTGTSLQAQGFTVPAYADVDLVDVYQTAKGI